MKMAPPADTAASDFADGDVLFVAASVLPWTSS
jgi:hypothetical protein